MMQRTEEWFKARCGSLGASSMHEIAAKTRNGYSARRASRMATIVVERITGAPVEGYTNAAMQHGIDTEPEAKAFYSFMTDNEIVDVGLIKHLTIAWSHASPDRLIGDDGLIEVKCPQPAAHLDTLLGQEVPGKYVIQAQWQMCCTGRAWCDFISYSPAFPESMRMFTKRIHRDVKHIEALESEVRQFLSEVDAKLAAIAALYLPKAA